MESKYSDGVCPTCGKCFPRPHKHKTETENYHIQICRLDYIEDMFKNEKIFGLEGWDIFYLIDELKLIAKQLSFGAGRYDCYMENMKRALKLKDNVNKILEEREINTRGNDK